MRINGRLASWNDSKGFGFVTPERGQQRVFVHISEFPRGRRPVEQERVSYLLGSDSSNKPCARKVRFLQASSASSGTRSAGAMSSLLGVGFVALLTALMLFEQMPAPVLYAYLLMSTFTFALYGFDKAAAKRGRQRTPEMRLHLFELACGWPGALAAQQIFRHKTRKRSFQVRFWLAVIINIAALAWFVFADQTSGLRNSVERLLLLLPPIGGAS